LALWILHVLVALVSGPEEPFNQYLGRCFNLFSLPNYGGLSHEGITYAETGRMAAGDSETLHAFLIFAADEVPFLSHPDTDKQRKRTSEMEFGLFCSGHGVKVEQHT
jgi:hypothetical protein